MCYFKYRLFKLMVWVKVVLDEKKEDTNVDKCWNICCKLYYDIRLAFTNLFSCFVYSNSVALWNSIDVHDILHNVNELIQSLVHYETEGNPFVKLYYSINDIIRGSVMQRIWTSVKCVSLGKRHVQAMSFIKNQLRNWLKKLL